MEALVNPLPNELTTPPVTKMCFVILSLSIFSGRDMDRATRKRAWTPTHTVTAARRAKWPGSSELQTNPSGYRARVFLTRSTESDRVQQHTLENSLRFGLRAKGLSAPLSVFMADPDFPWYDGR